MATPQCTVKDCGTFCCESAAIPYPGALCTNHKSVTRFLIKKRCTNMTNCFIIFDTYCMQGGSFRNNDTVVGVRHIQGGSFRNNDTVVGVRHAQGGCMQGGSFRNNGTVVGVRHAQGGLYAGGFF